MRIYIFIVPFLIFLIGCAGGTQNNYISQINKPVKNKGNYVRFGVGVGSAFHSYDYRTQEEDVTWGISTEIDIWKDVSKRWERAIIPTVWRVLLTGKQYDENRFLKAGIVHSSFTGGLTGIAYSQRDGLRVDFNFMQFNKYRFNSYLWSTSHFSVQPKILTDYFGDRSVYESSTGFSFGWQLVEELSLEAGGNYAYIYHENGSKKVSFTGNEDRVSGLGRVRYRVHPQHEFLFRAAVLQDRSYYYNSSHTSVRISLGYSYIML